MNDENDDEDETKRKRYLHLGAAKSLRAFIKKEDKRISDSLAIILFAIPEMNTTMVRTKW